MSVIAAFTAVTSTVTPVTVKPTVTPARLVYAVTDVIETVDVARPVEFANASIMAPLSA